MYININTINNCKKMDERTPLKEEKEIELSEKLLHIETEQDNVENFKKILPLKKFVTIINTKTNIEINLTIKSFLDILKLCNNNQLYPEEIINFVQSNTESESESENKNENNSSTNTKKSIKRYLNLSKSVNKRPSLNEIINLNENKYKKGNDATKLLKFYSIFNLLLALLFLTQFILLLINPKYRNLFSSFTFVCLLLIIFLGSFALFGLCNPQVFNNNNIFCLNFGVFALTSCTFIFFIQDYSDFISFKKIFGISIILFYLVCIFIEAILLFFFDILSKSNENEKDNKEEDEDENNESNKNNGYVKLSMNEMIDKEEKYI